MYTESYHLYEIYANFKYDENGEPEEDFEDANSIIRLSDDGNMTYSPNSYAR